MPLIEELANAPVSATPGFAYVPDTGFDPSREAIIPTGARRAARAGPTAYGAESLSRQEQQKISRRLADLERDNRADVHIVLPGKPSNVAARGLRGKMTPGIKKIMQSQKTIANHLADEEAAIAIAGTGNAMPPPAINRQPSGRISSTDGRRASTAVQPASADVMVVEPTTSREPEGAGMFEPPRLPTAEEIEALVSAPALSYAASRVGPSQSTVPPRQFCVMCGYWGRAKCKKCGDRVCGLECLAGHQDSCQRY